MKITKPIVGILIIILLFLAACTPSATPTPEIVEITKIVEQTVIVTQLVVVTATPLPPSPTPEATATPKFQKWTSSDAITSFQESGLEVGNFTAMTRDDYGAAPYVAIEGTHFLIPSLCEDCGGRILSFSNQDDLDITKNYYDELGKASAWFFSWLYVKDNILVQINGDLSEEKAIQYETALQGMK